MPFIRITESGRNDHHVHINVDYIVRVQAEGERTEVTLRTLDRGGRPETIRTDTNVDDVMTAISNASD